jgi:exosome complex component RRP42
VTLSAVKKSIVVEHLRRTQMVDLLSKGKRLDGRGLNDYRKIIIETNVIEKANGSAKVSIGNSQVVAGVKIETGTPFPDTPDKGLLVVNAEVLPLSSPYAEPGPPDESAIELARVVDRGIRESQMIDLSKLVLIKGKKVHAVFVDVSVLNVDGNLFDTTCYAAIAALSTAKMPELEVTDKDELKPKGHIISLTVERLPISVTMARIGDVMIVDPTAEEEALMDARITLTTDDLGNICAGQKGLPGTLTFEQVMMSAELSQIKGREIREIMKKAIGNG